jgi:hypothetical protein
VFDSSMSDYGLHARISLMDWQVADYRKRGSRYDGS